MKLGLYAVHVYYEFKCIRAINMAFMPKKPPFLPSDVTLGVDFPPPSSWARTTKLGLQLGQIVPYQSLIVKWMDP